MGESWGHPQTPGRDFAPAPLYEGEGDSWGTPPNPQQGGSCIPYKSKGMNALSHSDQEMVERMLPVFDAVYAYCVRRVQGQRGWANADPTWGNGRQ